MNATWNAPIWQARPWRHWLTDHGSLTRRIQARCPAFAVECLAQGQARPFDDEYGALGLARSRLAWVREVRLLCAGRPVVFAHTVAPLSGLRGPWRGLLKLGNRPLGAALFADPRIAREPLQFRRLDVRHPLYRAAARHLTAPPREFWARRSRFALDGVPILVSEVFLPEILNLP